MLGVCVTAACDGCSSARCTLLCVCAITTGTTAYPLQCLLRCVGSTRVLAALNTTAIVSSLFSALLLLLRLLLLLLLWLLLLLLVAGR